MTYAIAPTAERQLKQADGPGNGPGALRLGHITLQLELGQRQPAPGEHQAAQPDEHQRGDDQKQRWRNSLDEVHQSSHAAVTRSGR